MDSKNTESKKEFSIVNNRFSDDYKYDYNKFLEYYQRQIDNYAAKHTNYENR